MLLAIDIGNSQTVVGLFEGDRIRSQWRLTSQMTRTADELALQLRALLAEEGLAPGAVTRFAVASVVPGLTPEYRRVGEELFRTPTVVIDGTTDTGIPLLVPDPRSVGPDRIVNLVGALARHGAPAVVVDLGTATTFDALDTEGAYVGGAIAPGIGISAEALFQRGARLARVELMAPDRVIGRTTEEHLQSGIFFGAVGQIDEIVRRIRAEMGGTPRVIATGGLAEVVAAHSATIDVVDPDLTLHGIRLVEERIHGSSR
jgi:type III pantothenate kinase